MVSHNIYLAILLVIVAIIFVLLGYAELAIITVIVAVVFYALIKSKK